MIVDRSNCENWRDMTGDCCVVCGRFGANTHHEPPKGLTGKRHWKGALVSLCGSGVTGCHGLRHANRLQLAFDDQIGWIWRGESSREKTDDWRLCHNDDFWNALNQL